MLIGTFLWHCVDAILFIVALLLPAYVKQPSAAATVNALRARACVCYVGGARYLNLSTRLKMILKLKRQTMIIDMNWKRMGKNVLSVFSF